MVDLFIGGVVMAIGAFLGTMTGHWYMDRVRERRKSRFEAHMDEYRKQAQELRERIADKNVGRNDASPILGRDRDDRAD